MDQEDYNNFADALLEKADTLNKEEKENKLFNKQETIEIMYSCQKCGAQKVKINITARASEEDVVQWMNGVVSKCGDNHKDLTGCIPDALDLYIPAEKDRNWIGGPRIN